VFSLSHSIVSLLMLRLLLLYSRLKGECDCGRGTHRAGAD
jgi:hypothetical protein